jgi:hypothetical protein
MAKPQPNQECSILTEAAAQGVPVHKHMSSSRMSCESPGHQDGKFLVPE